jgi:hypothetical protein
MEMFPKMLIGGIYLYIYTLFFSQIKDNPGLLIKPLAENLPVPAPDYRATGLLESCLTSWKGATKMREQFRRLRMHPAAPRSV